MTHSPTLNTLEVQAHQPLPIAKEGICLAIRCFDWTSRGHKKKRVSLSCIFTYMKSHKNQPKVKQCYASWCCFPTHLKNMLGLPQFNSGENSKKKL